MGKCQCAICNKEFHRKPQAPNQQYCSGECRKEAKRRWQREKLKSDPSYHDNQKDAQRRWRERNPDYNREYRLSHPECLARNREKQKERNRRRCEKIVQPSRQPPRIIAKMDGSTQDGSSLFSGTYKIISLDVSGLEKIAKMDGPLAKFILFQNVGQKHPRFGDNCKEMIG